MKSLLYSVLGVALWLFASCSQEVKISLRTDEPSPLVKEYANVVVPPNIAPLNFFVDAADGKEGMVLSSGDSQLSVVCKDGALIPALDGWKELLANAKGKTMKVEHCVQTDDGWKV